MPRPRRPAVRSVQGLRVKTVGHGGRCSSWSGWSAKGAVGRYAFLDAFQGEVVAEFADDKEAVKKLIVTAKEGGPFAHVAQQLRDARADVAKRAAIEAALTEAGLRVLTAEGRQDREKVRDLSTLVDADKQSLDEENHSGCPGHAVYVSKGWHDIEAPADEDQDESDDDEDQAAEGAEATRWKEVYDWMPHHVCADFRQHGHQDRYSSGIPAKKTAAEKTDEERDADRAKRRAVIQSNKDWVSATTVRQEWLRTFLTRKAAPKGTAGFLAASLGGSELALVDGYGLAYELLGLNGEGTSYQQFATAYAQAVSRASEARAQVLSLALVLSAYEYQLRHKDSWRSIRSEVPHYLRFLASCKYPLADIERRACGEKPEAAAEPKGEDPADQADDE
jgi:ParB family chromosome partitioning protein